VGFCKASNNRAIVSTNQSSLKLFSVGKIFPAEKLNEIRWRNYLVKETQLLLRMFATLFLLNILKIRNPKKKKYIKGNNPFFG
jgi:hypothetical protein